MLHVNLAKARELVQLAVDERGADYVYPYESCVYVLKEGDAQRCTGKGGLNEDGDDRDRIPEDQPGCIVGLAFHKAGFTLEQINVHGDVRDFLYTMSNRGLVTYTPAAIGWLKEAQRSQDQGFSWGESVRRANNIDLGGYHD